MDIFVEFGYTFIWKKTEFAFQLCFLLVILFLILNDCWNFIVDLHFLENRTNQDFGFLSFKNCFHFIPEWMSVSSCHQIKFLLCYEITVSHPFQSSSLNSLNMKCYRILGRKSSYSEIFCSVFSRIRVEYEEKLRKIPTRITQNMDT